MQIYYLQWMVLPCYRFPKVSLWKTIPISRSHVRRLCIKTITVKTVHKFSYWRLSSFERKQWREVMATLLPSYKMELGFGGILWHDSNRRTSTFDFSTQYHPVEVHAFGRKLQEKMNYSRDYVILTPADLRDRYRTRISNFLSLINYKLLIFAFLLRMRVIDN